MTLRRVYFVCRQCRLGVHPLDVRLGVTDSTSHQAQRLLCLAGSSWSFDRAAQHLREFCGLSVSDNKIRDVCQRHGVAAAAWQRERKEAHQGFRNATGDIEFSTDGTSVNTWEGWREMRLGIFSKRHRGEAAAPENWDDRELPARTFAWRLPPSKTANASARVGGSGFSDSAFRTRRRSQHWPTEPVGYGSKWPCIFPEPAGCWTSTTPWNISRMQPRRSTDKIPSAADGGSSQCARFLLSGGWPAVRQRLRAAWLRTEKRSHRKTLQSLASYLGKHRWHLDYALRLAEGRSIGSGQVEGACKHVIGRRLKQTGARWRVRRVNRMASLCCLVYSDHWDLYWAAS